MRYAVLTTLLLITLALLAFHQPPKSGSISLNDGIRPNPQLTPGFANPDVTQANIKTTICKAGWTATIRPPVSYTTTLKRKQIAQYGYADTAPADYEEDHLISLELGGSPTDAQNLWPQSYKTAPNARSKDQVEDWLKRQVCAGKKTLKDAQREIRLDWTVVDTHASFGGVGYTDEDDI